MAKLVVNIKGQSNGNKKQYARLGNNVTKLIVRKNNQKFYVQKDPILFTDK